MTRHAKFLGSNAKPVVAGQVDPSVVQLTINPSVEEINMNNINNETVAPEAIIDNAETIVEETVEMTLEEAAVVGRKFRKSSVLWSGGMSAFITATACLLARSFNDDVKLNNKDILVRTAVNAAAATTIQAGLQLASKRVNDSRGLSFITGHLVGCVTPVVGMRAMVASGIGATGYAEAGTGESELLAGLAGPVVVTDEPVDAVL